MPAPRSANTGGANPEFYLREFEGVNNIAAREAINDNEFWWCENIIPIAGGAAYPLALAYSITTITGETGPPVYTTNFNRAGIDYIFAVWDNGDAFIVNIAARNSNKIATAVFTEGCYAVAYGNAGLLIIAPNGYYDYDVTFPGVLTTLNNTIAAFTNTVLNTVAGGTQLKQIATTSGTGGIFQAFYEVTSVTITNPGTGYSVGESLTLTDGTPTTPAQIIVASISGTGSTGPIATITLPDGGSYPGPQNTTLQAIGPTGTVITATGGGSGASFSVIIEATTVKILSVGANYSNLDHFSDETSAGTVIDSWDLVTSGVIGGSSIAVYEGRVWISNQRTVYFTDIDAYLSFGGAGGSFTINDSYLHNVITVLYAANNYLYIFGDSSIDALSNVTVSAGVTSFSRVNVTASVGTTAPTSVFAYYRAIVFWHPTGFYLLAGATPEKISEKISGALASMTGVGLPLVYSAQVNINAENCAAFLFNFYDNFTEQYAGTIRTVIALYFRGRWFFGSMYASATGSQLPMQAMCSVPYDALHDGSDLTQGAASLYVWSNLTLYQCFPPLALGTFGQNPTPWIVRTKLWDGGVMMHEKQSINAAFAGIFNNSAAADISLTVDTELGSSAAINFGVGAGNAYELLVQSANEGGSQYLGLTFSGGGGLNQMHMVALRGKADRNMLL